MERRAAVRAAAMKNEMHNAVSGANRLRIQELLQEAQEKGINEPWVSGWGQGHFKHCHASKVQHVPCELAWHAPACSAQELIEQNHSWLLCLGQVLRGEHAASCLMELEACASEQPGDIARLKAALGAWDAAVGVASGGW